MGKNAFAPVRTGESVVIYAEAYNAMLGAAQDYRNKNEKPSKVGQGRDSLYVYITNKTGKSLVAYDIVGLDGPLNPKDMSAQIVFRGVVPYEKHYGKFAVVQEDAEPDQLVRACVYGVTQARIKTDDVEVETCDVMHGATEYLKSGGKIGVLWIEPASDKKEPRWAIIRIGGGEGGGGKQHGTIMKAVPPTALTAHHQPWLGEVRIDGKEYKSETDENGEEKPIEYDNCACLELSVVGNEHLLPGMRVKLTGPYSYTIAESDTSTAYYLAVETPGEYFGNLDGRLDVDGTATITVTDDDAEEKIRFNVQCTLLKGNHFLDKEAGVRVVRGWGTTTDTPALEVIGVDCPEAVAEE